MKLTNEINEKNHREMKKTIIIFLILIPLIIFGYKINSVSASNPCEDKYSHRPNSNIWEKEIDKASRVFDGIPLSKAEGFKDRIYKVPGVLPELFDAWYGINDTGGLRKKICSNEEYKNLKQYIIPTHTYLNNFNDNFGLTLKEIQNLKGKDRGEIINEGDKILKKFDNLYNKIKSTVKSMSAIGSHTFDFMGKPLTEDAMKELQDGLGKINDAIFKMTPGIIETDATSMKIAVTPIGFLGLDYKNVTLKNIIDTIKNYFLKIAAPLFVLLVVVGGIYYILNIFNPGFLQKGKDWIVWAVIGYFILLIAAAIISLLESVVGPPK